MSHRIASTEALLQKSWEAKMWNESQERDIFSGLTGTYSDQKQTLADAVTMRVNLPDGKNEHTIPLLLDLTGSGREAAGLNLTGFTESIDTRKFTVYANDLRHGVDTETYGLYAHRNAGYGILEKTQPLLSRWMKARIGKYKREALLERFSTNLTNAPVSQTQNFNQNILVKNVADGTQPTYDSTTAQYNANIRTALSSAGTGSGAQADMDFFSYLEYYVTTQWKIEPFDDGTYVVTVPAAQATFLKQLQSSEAFANSYAAANSQKYVDAAYGQYLMRHGKFHLIVDDRAPVLDHDTSNATLTAYYRDVGSTDNRTSSTNNTYDVGFVLGKSALTEAIAMKPRFDDDISDFNRLRSIGISSVVGYHVTEFDDDTETDTSRIAQNSGVWLAARGTFTA